MIEKYTFDLCGPRKVRRKMIFAKADTEGRAHVVLKLLAFLLFYDSRLRVEQKLGMRYKPDLVIDGEYGIPELWIDCGHVALKKIQSLARKFRRTRIVIVKETHQELRHFKNLVAKKVEQTARFEYLAFEPHFVDEIASALRRNNEAAFYEVMEDVIGLALNDRVFESRLYR